MGRLLERPGLNLPSDPARNSQGLTAKTQICSDPGSRSVPPYNSCPLWLRYQGGWFSILELAGVFRKVAMIPELSFILYPFYSHDPERWDQKPILGHTLYVIPSPKPDYLLFPSPVLPLAP